MITPGATIKLTKISDEVFDGKHPNGNTIGFTATGKLVTGIEVGSQIFLIDHNGNCGKWFHTSVVTDIINENTVRTENSTYRITQIN